MSFNKQLVLNRYFLSLFGVENFEEFTLYLSKSEFEEIRSDGYSQFVYLLDANFSSSLYKYGLDFDKLKEYDENISEHTQKLKRDIKWKYYQYLTLLFTEIYLDKFFSDCDKFCDDLNDFLDAFCQKNRLKISPFQKDALNRVSFWSATGSGKTLIMHINFYQYNFYSKSENSVFLITPNEALSKQHLEELSLSNFSDVGVFDKNSTLKKSFNILDNHKIADKMGNKTIAIGSLGTGNIVFIDEGHKGQSGKSWKQNRDLMSRNGFRFEYSATFGQSLSKENESEYAKSILFDYSYKYFYNDGYGKDYAIYNIKDDQEASLTYKIGSLLSFYEQLKVYEQNRVLMSEYKIEKPLMAFVGHSVNATSKAKKVVDENKEAVSDVAEALVFLDYFLKNRDESRAEISNILAENSGIRNIYDTDIYKDKFGFLKEMDIDDIYTDMKKLIFNSNSTDASLQLNELKLSGEISLSVSDTLFGVVNVGETTKLIETSKNNGITIKQKAISSSPFDSINKTDSKINILIGAKKFSEGWSSWRVSSMMLLRVGQSEGSQIIQLFGRGVRLKGYDFSLKRSVAFGKPLERNLRSVETLNIFGIKANYMTKFQEYLEKEGVKTHEKFEICLPIEKKDSSTLDKLKILTKNVDEKIFKTLDTYKKVLDVDKNIQKTIIVDLYTQSQITQSQQDNLSLIIDKNRFVLEDIYVKLLNWDDIYFEMIDYKKRKRYTNIVVRKELLRDIISSGKFEIYINKFELKSKKDLSLLIKIVLEILKKYFDNFYKFYKDEWETEHLQYEKVDEEKMGIPYCKEKDGYLLSIGISGFENNSNLMEFIKLLAKRSDSDIVKQIKSIANSSSDLKEKLKNCIENYDVDTCDDDKSLEGIEIFCLDRHLYNPLIYKEASEIFIDIVPVALNDGEKQFVKDLKNYLENKDIEMYLLRNQSKSGVGFYGFYPDFIMWILKDDKQYISFIDPKGMKHVGFNDDKVELFSKIKELQDKLGNSDIILNSFIISNTSFQDMKTDGKTAQEWERKNVLFQDDSGYIEKLFKGQR